MPSHHLMPMHVRERGAVDVLIVAVLVAGLVGAGLGLWIGHGWGESTSANEVADLRGKLGTVTGERNLAQSVSQGNAGQLTSLRKTLAAERAGREQAAAAATEELAARADRIATLERNAAQRIQTITQKANHDEDCAPLRTLPVCPAVAERLWGDPAATGTH